jgi:RNA polymerase sigma factor (sigma-70 family)
MKTFRSPYGTHAALIQAIKNKEYKAFTHLYDTCWNIVIFSIMKKGGAEVEAQDMFQEGIIILFEKYHKDNYNPKYPAENYLIGICLRKWKKENKGRMNRKGYAFAQIRPILSTDNPLHKIFRDSFSKLNPKCQEIIALRYYTDYSYEEIAQKNQQYDEMTLKNNKYRCMKELKSLVSKSIDINSVKTFSFKAEDEAIIDHFMIGIATTAQLMTYHEKLNSSLNFMRQVNFIRNVVDVVTILEREKFNEQLRNYTDSMRIKKNNSELKESEPVNTIGEIRIKQFEDNQVYVSIDDLKFNIEIDQAIAEYESIGRVGSDTQMLDNLDNLKKEYISSNFDL